MLCERDVELQRLDNGRQLRLELISWCCNGGDMTSRKKANTLAAEYDPNHLIDSLIERLKLRNDAALSRVLGVEPPVISKIRHRRLAIGASILIRMHETSDIAINELRALMGDRREKFRVGHFKEHANSHKEEMGSS
jgi:hypothetical protein